MMFIKHHIVPLAGLLDKEKNVKMEVEKTVS